MRAGGNQLIKSNIYSALHTFGQKINDNIYIPFYLIVNNISLIIHQIKEYSLHFTVHMFSGETSNLYNIKLLVI